MKGKDGKPLYKAADHMKAEEVDETMPYSIAEMTGAKKTMLGVNKA